MEKERTVDRSELEEEVRRRVDLQEEYDEHRVLYAELEHELRYLETERDEYKRRWESEAQEKTFHVEKYNDAVREHSTTMLRLQRELEKYIQLHETIQAKKRSLEQVNDELERHSRVIESSLSDMEARYNQLLESNVMLESELEVKSELEINLQRCKDEIRDLSQDLQDELAVRTVSHTNNDNVVPMDTTVVEATELDKRLRSTSAVAVSPLHTSKENSGPLINGASGKDVDIPLLMQQMMGRVKGLERRLANCRTLIKPLLVVTTDVSVNHDAISQPSVELLSMPPS